MNSEKSLKLARVVLGLITVLPGILYLLLRTVFSSSRAGFVSIIIDVLYPFLVFSPFLAIGSVGALLVVALWVRRVRSSGSVVVLCLCLAASGLYIFMAYDFLKLLRHLVNGRDEPPQMSANERF